MSVVPAGHAGIRVSQRLGDHLQRHATHGQDAAVGVAQDVKGNCWSDLGNLTGIAQSPAKMGSGLEL
jgi:hypothetical protein